jgi:hypothetical protein
MGPNQACSCMTISLGFLAFDKMSELNNDGPSMAKKTQPRPETCFKVYSCF